MTPSRAVTAGFTSFDAFVAALEKLQGSEFRRYFVYSPVALDEYEHLLPTQGSPVRIFSLTAGFVGCFLGFWMCIGSALLYSLVVGGKLPVAWIPYCVIGFELTILTSGLTTLAVAFAFSRLYPRQPAPQYDEAFSDDQFGISVSCAEDECQSVSQLLQSAGAIQIREA